MLHLLGQPFGCSTCQKPLVFKTERANCLICPFCSTMHTRLALDGKPGLAAEMVKEEMSILRLGSSGAYAGKAFEVVGRIQYFFQDSYRNHWLLAFQNGEAAWLGDWAGNFSIFREINGLHADDLRKAAPGKWIGLKENSYQVELMDEHRLTFAEGEIPDQYLTGKNFITLYLTNPSREVVLVNILASKNAANSATLEAFIGKFVEPETLNFQNLRSHDDWR